MIFLKIGIRDRGCIFHEYDDGCIRDSRTHRKGENAERMECLKFYPWACREQRHDCHRRMESYLIYENVYFETAHLAVSFTVHYIHISRGGIKNGNF